MSGWSVLQAVCSTIDCRGEAPRQIPHGHPSSARLSDRNGGTRLKFEHGWSLTHTHGCPSLSAQIIRAAYLWRSIAHGIGPALPEHQNLPGEVVPWWTALYDSGLPAESQALVKTMQCFSFGGGICLPAASFQTQPGQQWQACGCCLRASKGFPFLGPAVWNFGADSNGVNSVAVPGDEYSMAPVEYRH